MTSDVPTGLPDDVTLESLDLTVSDVDRARAFYEQVIGLEPVTAPLDGASRRDAATASEVGAEPELVLGRDRRPIVCLRSASTSPTRRRDAPPGSAPPRNATGLFHLAVLLPSRADLASFVAALVAARTPVVGVADHGVSEAIYLEDPDGHGVEVYADRPRDDWPMREGRIAMTTDPLDVDGLLAEARPAPGRSIAPDVARDAGSDATHPWRAPVGTRLGHVHLRVRDVDEARAFYSNVVGFDEVASLPGASFLSVGGYHHHLGVNAWQSAGGSPAGYGVPRLERVRASVGSSDALDALRARLGPSACEQEDSEVAAFHDPSGVAWRFVVRGRPSP